MKTPSSNQQKLDEIVRRLLREFDADLADYPVVVPATGGSALKWLDPGLWAARPQVLAISKTEAVLLTRSGFGRRVNRVVWRGAPSLVGVHSWFGGTMATLRLPASAPWWYRKVQLSGRVACQRVIDALRTPDDR